MFFTCTNILIVFFYSWQEISGWPSIHRFYARLSFCGWVKTLAGEQQKRRDFLLHLHTHLLLWGHKENFSGRGFSDGCSSDGGWLLWRVRQHPAVTCVCPGDAVLADCVMLEVIGLAEFHQSGCPLLLRKQLQTHIFCLALYPLPRGLQHRLIRMEGRRPITKVYCSQQSCANLLVSVLLLSKVLNKNIKGKRGERSLWGVSETSAWGCPSASPQFLL